jgi:hypothetical protein
MRDHRAVSAPDEAVVALAARYREVLVGVDSHRIEPGGKPRSSNQLVNRMQTLQLQLLTTQAGSDAITSLIGAEKADSVARAELEREAGTDSGLSGADDPAGIKMA